MPVPSIPCWSAVEALEGYEDPFDLLGGQTGTGVGDGHIDLVGAGRLAAELIIPPWWLYFTALEARLTMTCRSRLVVGVHGERVADCAVFDGDATKRRPGGPSRTRSPG